MKCAALWKNSPLAVVADASALAWLEPGPTPAKAIRVVTPHPGEAGRLLDKSTDAVQADRLGALREISSGWAISNCGFKGQPDFGGAGTGALFINSSGNPFLAQGGSGDLLAGFLTGLLAQPAWQRDPLTAVRYGRLAAWRGGRPPRRDAAELDRRRPRADDWKCWV